jgi:transposase
MDHPTSCCRALGAADAYCDLLVGLDGYHVTSVARAPDGLVVRVEWPPGPVGCPDCGVRATSRGRREHRLVDIPAFGTPVRLVWVKRTWACPETTCRRRSFTEVDEDLAPPRSTWTTRARSWAVGQLRREHATVYGLARQLGLGWDTVWSGIEPILAAAAADESRFAGVTSLGVDEHVWLHVSTKAPQDGGRGPKELTGMVDLSTGEKGQVRARLLDLVPGRSKKAYADWLTQRGQSFTAGIEVATLDPFHG